MYPADEIVFRPTGEPAKVVRSQNFISGAGPPKTQDEGEHGKEDGPDKTTARSKIRSSPGPAHGLDTRPGTRQSTLWESGGRELPDDYN